MGNATAVKATGSIEFELAIALEGTPKTRFFVRCRYRDLLSLQGELIRESYLSAPVLLPAAKSATAEARRASAEELLTTFTALARLPPSVSEFLETQDHPLITAVLRRCYGIGDAAAAAAAERTGPAPLVELIEAGVQWPNREPYPTYFGSALPKDRMA